MKVILPSMVKHIVAGGTFDLFHRGHRDFLKKALGFADEITVGVTSDKFARSLDKSPFDPVQTRLKNVESYIKKISRGKKFNILTIDDIFGTAASDVNVNLIAVTENTYEGALNVNKKRVEKSLKPLKIITFLLTLASDGKPISSTRIKNGEISQEGLNYLNYMTSFKASKLPENLRDTLREPQGHLYKDIKAIRNKEISVNGLISVGDQITYNLLREGITPRLSIIDFKVERRKKFRNLIELGFPRNQIYETAINPAGSITRDLVINIGKILSDISNTNVITIDGEEDLAVLPAALLSPMGPTVVYGQKNEGVVVVKVNLNTKRHFLKLFNSFKRQRFT